ncbi:hypothetical protein FKM82_004870 [Ascaphus truei]
MQMELSLCSPTSKTSVSGFRYRSGSALIHLVTFRGRVLKGRSKAGPSHITSPPCSLPEAPATYYCATPVHSGPPRPLGYYLDGNPDSCSDTRTNSEFKG